MKRVRARVHGVLSPAQSGDFTSWIVDVLIIALILLDVVCFVLDTVPEIHASHGTLFLGIEDFVVAVFTLEYFLRLWACRADPRYRGFLFGRIRYALTPMALVDLVAILPALHYVPGLAALFPSQLVIVRSVRFVRIVRLGKLARYLSSIQTLGRSMWRVRHEFSAILLTLLLLILLFSTLIYTVEHRMGGGFTSIPKAMWWSIVTMTTVGYGDMTPQTPLGRLIGAVVMICGIGMFALPAGVLGAAFAEEVRKVTELRRLMRRRRKRREQREAAHRSDGTLEVRCPHCARSFVPEPEEPEARPHDS
jgi:voltage-gated potassium channel